MALVVEEEGIQSGPCPASHLVALTHLQRIEHADYLVEVDAHAAALCRAVAHHALPVKDQGRGLIPCRVAHVHQRKLAGRAKTGGV